MEQTNGIAFLPVGGALDFIAGTQLRAPALVRYLNLEWAWRLALNPRGLYLRYFRSAVIFFSLLFEMRRGGRTSSQYNGRFDRY
jgi:UDP-N-acetyl-D-mannosaminuronic acid transferase (WecB/TagA/CpsF family)